MIDVTVTQGLKANSATWQQIFDDPLRVEFASELHASDHILCISNQYSEYVLRRTFPSIPMQISPYSPVNFPNPVLNPKKRSPAITGNIGESLFCLLARDLLNVQASEVFPIAANTSGKHPDFLIRMQGPLDQILGLQSVPVATSHFWPAEAKAVTKADDEDAAITRALNQLGAYWYRMRQSATVGYGLISCFVNEASTTHPLPKINLYVITPSDKPRLEKYIDLYYSIGRNQAGFLKDLSKKKSNIRGCLLNGR